MEHFPRPDVILAGFLLQIFIGNLISVTSDGYKWDNSVVCKQSGIGWFLLIALSAGVAFLTTIKSSRDKKVAHGVIAFQGSFLLNLFGDRLGSLVVLCSGLRLSDTYVSILIMALATLVITVVYFLNLNRKAPSNEDEITNLPDPEIIFLGVCGQNMFWRFLWATNNSPYQSVLFCEAGGVGSWLELLAVSGILVVFNFIKNGATLKLLFTFIESFAVNLTLGQIDWMAMTCANPDLNDHVITYLKVTLAIHGIVAIRLTTIFLRRNTAPSYNTTQLADQASYPPEAYPMEASYLPQA